MLTIEKLDGLIEDRKTYGNFKINREDLDEILSAARKWLELKGTPIEVVNQNLYMRNATLEAECATLRELVREAMPTISVIVNAEPIWNQAGKNMFRFGKEWLRRAEAAIGGEK